MQNQYVVSEPKIRIVLFYSLLLLTITEKIIVDKATSIVLMYKLLLVLIEYSFIQLKTSNNTIIKGIDFLFGIEDYDLIF